MSGEPTIDGRPAVTVTGDAIATGAPAAVDAAQEAPAANAGPASETRGTPDETRGTGNAAGADTGDGTDGTDGGAGLGQDGTEDAGAGGTGDVSEAEAGDVSEAEAGDVSEAEAGDGDVSEAGDHEDEDGTAGSDGPRDDGAGGGRAGPGEAGEQAGEQAGERAAVEAGPPSPPRLADPADAARRRFRRALVPRASRSQMLAAAVCALVGFSAVVQSQQPQVKSLSSLRQPELITVLDNVTQESARLDDQAAGLQRTLDELRSSTDNAPAAREAARSRLDTLGVLAGTLAATGPGIELDITDPRVAVNATDLLETVQELRDAGAEAMQFGPVRVVARTAFVDDAAGLLADQTVVSPPYKLLAIGDPQTLGAALEIPGGVLEVLRGKNAQGTVRTRESITITALVPEKAPQYARAATTPAP